MNSWWRINSAFFWMDSWFIKAYRPTPQKPNQRKVRRDARRRAAR